MPRTTRNVELDELGDLLGRPGRAALGFVRAGAPVVVPARLNWAEGRWRIGLDPANGDPPTSGDEVVLVVDEGRYFFDLRAVYVRGRAGPTGRPEPETGDLTWIEVTPTRIVGWDYGRMRYTGDDRAGRTDGGSPGGGSDGGG